MPKANRPTDTVRLFSRHVPADLHRRLKVLAAQTASTMEATLNDALHRGLKELERELKN